MAKKRKDNKGGNEQVSAVEKEYNLRRSKICAKHSDEKRVILKEMKNKIGAARERLEQRLLEINDEKEHELEKLAQLNEFDVLRSSKKNESSPKTVDSNIPSANKFVASQQKWKSTKTGLSDGSDGDKTIVSAAYDGSKSAISNKEETQKTDYYTIYSYGKPKKDEIVNEDDFMSGSANTEGECLIKQRNNKAIEMSSIDVCHNSENYSNRSGNKKIPERHGADQKKKQKDKINKWGGKARIREERQENDIGEADMKENNQQEEYDESLDEETETFGEKKKKYHKALTELGPNCPDVMSFNESQNKFEDSEIDDIDKRLESCPMELAYCDSKKVPVKSVKAVKFKDMKGS